MISYSSMCVCICLSFLLWLDSLMSDESWAHTICPFSPPQPRYALTFLADCLFSHNFQIWECYHLFQTWWKLVKRCWVKRHTATLPVAQAPFLPAGSGNSGTRLWEWFKNGVFSVGVHVFICAPISSWERCKWAICNSIHVHPQGSSKLLDAPHPQGLLRY